MSLELWLLVDKRGLKDLNTKFCTWRLFPKYRSMLLYTALQDLFFLPLILINQLILVIQFSRSIEPVQSFFFQYTIITLFSKTQTHNEPQSTKS